MNTIRRATEKDIPRVLTLLEQVNLVHQQGRPDLFKLATKYTADDLCKIFADDDRPVFVSVNAQDEVEGYAFCVLKEIQGDQLMMDIKTLYIDDLCVDEKIRGKHIGSGLYAYVLDYAKKIGCYNVTLNVWSCNESAMKFYEKCGLVPQKVGMEKIL